MKISDERVLKQFLDTGVLATMRNYHYKVGQEVRIKYNGKTIAKGFIVGVFANRIAFRKAFLKYSGFNTIEEWEKKAKEICGRMPDYIIIVFKVDVDLECMDINFPFRKAIEIEV